MRGVTITDRKRNEAVLAIDLIDILRLLGPQAEESEWEIGDLECVGAPAAEELQQRAESAVRLPGRTLLRLAAGVPQVIDGVFSGYRRGENDPWVRVRAVDSSAYDVESDDEAVLTRMKQCFREVAELPAGDAG
jgi:hypothetical protein